MESRKKVVLGILAHVDAGKTTLAEGILYLNGKLRKLGRVDHKDAFLDTYALERARGITIFSKQALVGLGEYQVTLLDTPGHMDFSAEMERTLQVLDAAILVISGADGVQGHVETLWRLLKRYGVPVFLFINKMDQAGTDRGKLLAEVQKRLDERCVDFGEDQERETFLENLALCRESLMEEYLESGEIADASVRRAIGERELFPCFFGSALKLTGVEEFLEGLRRFWPEESSSAAAGGQAGVSGGSSAAAGSQTGVSGGSLVSAGKQERSSGRQAFGARVYKISRDAQGNRLTHLKITSGSLKVKSLIGTEKVDQIRIYDGAAFQLADFADAGTVCALTGLKETYSGQGIGTEKEGTVPLLEPVLTYRIRLPEGSDAAKSLGRLRELEEEIPELHIVWKEGPGEIHAQVMGEVQIEVLKNLIEERFGLAVEFDEGSIVYKETILGPVEGIGHFEPLRHYAEVHLLLEPGEAGSGLQFESVLSEDALDRNWQRLILTHLEEKQHVGVLTGSEITDMRITLVGGRAHLKHTEGGDFRQATYRAVRQGLRKARCALLEPMYAFTLEVPEETIGRAMTDIQKMQGSFQPPALEGGMALFKGKAPVVTMRGYQTEVVAYTHGRGRLVCEMAGYEPCHNAEEVIERTGYDPEADLENPTGSVFCAHGAGFVVPWNQVDAFAHVETGLQFPADQSEEMGTGEFGNGERGNGESGNGRQGGQGRNGCGPGIGQAWPGAGSGSRSAGFGDRGVGSDRRTRNASRGSADASGRRAYGAEEAELEEIFTRTYGPSKRDRNLFERSRERMETRSASSGRDSASGNGTSLPGESTGMGPGSPREEYLLVDGYNIIFAWEDLRELSRESIDGARGRLMDILCNYQGFRHNTVILVFDAYKVKGNPGSVEKYHNIYVVYTKEAETADQYIEKTVHQIGRKYHVTVATSDALEQMIIWGEGATRLSAAGFREEIEAVRAQIAETAREKLPDKKHYPFQGKLDTWEEPGGPGAEQGSAHEFESDI